MRKLTLKRHRLKLEISVIITEMGEIMKRSKFTETQIVSILKLAEKGLKLPIFAENIVSGEFTSQ